ncbi:hypothetical protein F5X99DRAFT_407617 [Biscogniauxia marginata]|nr:hypothetical protein F5X99DRAFT_407617 [Biscogniauxia marginata]
MNPLRAELYLSTMSSSNDPNNNNNNNNNSGDASGSAGGSGGDDAPVYIYKWTPREFREGDPGGPEPEGVGSNASGNKGGHHDNTGTSSTKGGHHGGGAHHGKRPDRKP